VQKATILMKKAIASYTPTFTSCTPSEIDTIKNILVRIFKE